MKITHNFAIYLNSLTYFYFQPLPVIGNDVFIMYISKHHFAKILNTILLCLFFKSTQQNIMNVF
jgi:hypothetical protein